MSLLMVATGSTQEAAESQALDVVPTGEGQEYEMLPTKLLHAMTEEHGQLPMRLAAVWTSIGPGLASDRDLSEGHGRRGIQIVR